MRKETGNGNFDRSCFVQTVYPRTVLLTEVASEGWNKPAYSVGLKRARLMNGCVHCDARHRHYRLATSEKPGETGRTFHSVCRELLVGLLLGVAKDGREHSLCGKVRSQHTSYGRFFRGRCKMGQIEKEFIYIYLTALGNLHEVCKMALLL